MRSSAVTVVIARSRSAKRLFGRLPQLFVRAVEPAFEPDAHDGERRAKIMGDVVADAFQLADEPENLVEHEIDGADDLVDVVGAAAYRQAFEKSP